jgi:hypothetical protein
MKPASIDSQLENYRQVLCEYEPAALYENWFELLRAIEELGNIPMELDSFFDYMMLPFDVSDTAFKDTQEEISKKYSPKVSERFSKLFMMCTQLNVSTVSEAVEYFQARRVHLAATLLLIPHLCKGTKKIAFTELLSTIENNLVNLPAAYFNLISDGSDHSDLQDLFVQTIWMALRDNGEFSEPDYYDGEYQKIPAGKVHSYVNIENTLLQFRTAYEKYAISDSIIYQQLQILIQELKKYCEDDYTIIVPETAFNIIGKDLMPFLVLTNTAYYNVINSSAAFVMMNGYAQTSVTLLTAFVNQLQAKILSRNKNFRITSGILFEKKISDILIENEFVLAAINRINDKEFDLITTKNNITYNFHCKNNLIDVVKADSDYKTMERLNRLRVKRYANEVKKDHFVISRFPVIASQPGIVNFTALDEFLKSV